MGEAVDKIIEALRPVAEKIGEGAAHLYGVYVQQAVIDGGRKVGLGVLLLILLAVAVTVSIKNFKAASTLEREYLSDVKERSYYSHGDMKRAIGDMQFKHYFATVVSGLASLILLIIALCHLYDGIPMLVNPEYYAINELFSQVTGK